MCLGRNSFLSYSTHEGTLDFLSYIHIPMVKENEISGALREGHVRVQRSDGLWNLQKYAGELLSDEWFVRVSDFVEGTAYVEREGKLANHIRQDGTFCFPEWYPLET